MKKDTQVGGVTISLETGKLAQQTDAAVLGRAGDTVVLATVVTAEPREGIDFFPLSVEYMERLYAGGMISSSRFIKRETRPASEEILKARLIDRSLRPLFPEDFRNEVQIVVTVLSYDKKNDPALIGLTAASCAVMLAGIPFAGPVGAVRVGMDKEKQFVLNPVKDEEETLEIDRVLMDLDLVVSASAKSIIMIEAGANQIPEDTIISAMEFGSEAIQSLISLQQEMLDEAQVKIREYKSYKLDEALLGKIQHDVKDALKEALFIKEKAVRNEKIHAMEAEMNEKYAEEYGAGNVAECFHHLQKVIARDAILHEGKRVDGRKLDEIRPISIEVGVLPRTHGSALFQRGETQALSVVTLGSNKFQQLTESIKGEEMKRYMHHYNFPGWSVGEVSRNLYYPGRREIGHGALAERALLPVLPSETAFPYAIRVVSEILSSNGSTSMASTCGSSLSLMDAGVPISDAVGGIAMGLIMDEETGKYAVLSDIQGLEDHFGDMDFKVTGTKNGVTAIQMDNKLTGISVEILRNALTQAKEGRLFILGKMNAVISEPRKEISQYAPQIAIIRIDPKKIGELIGPGGKIIKGIIEQTGADIDIDDKGTVSISSLSAQSREEAMQAIESITEEVTVGKIYKGKVAKIMNFGAFVNITPTQAGLVHVSEIQNDFLKDPSTVLKEGQTVTVKVINIDDQGRINLSIKQANNVRKDE